MPNLPAAFLRIPIAHRALHDENAGRPENSHAAIRAAIRAGYAIEIDIQPSRDGIPMVFHDYDMKRLTGIAGPIARQTAADLCEITLLGGGEGIPTLTQILDDVSGRVPLLIEIKDQDGTLGPSVGRLEQTVAAALTTYTGPVAVMSFNPHSVAAFGQAAPDIPRGLTTSAFYPEGWGLIPAATRNRLRDIPDFDAVGASFLSHDHRDLTRPRVAELRQQGVPVLCWTIRSPEQEAEARKIAHNITFEGYAAPIPAPSS